MTRTWLSSTTALAMILTTSAPLPLSAQTIPDCPNELEFPCLVPGTQVRINGQAEFDALVQAGGLSGYTAPGDAAAQAAAEAEAAAAEKAQAEADKAAQAAADAEAAANAAAEAAAAEKAQAEADQAAADAEAAAQAAADAAAAEKAQAEADQAAQAAADAEAAAKAAADAAAADAQAEADNAAQAAADAEAAAKADADAAAADAQAEADKAAQAAADLEAARIEAELASKAGAEGGDDATADAQAAEDATEAGDEVPQVDAEAQAEAAARAEEEGTQAAAASGDAEVVSTEEATVTEDQARSSDEEFATTASGQETPAAQADSQPEAQAAPVAQASKKKPDTAKILGAVAVLGLGAYVVNKYLDNGDRVVSNTGDRVVLQDEYGQYRIIKDDDTLLRRPGSNVETQTFADGSTRSIVTAQDGSRTITIRASDGRVLRRTRELDGGREVTLFDDTRTSQRVDVSQLQSARAENYDYSNVDLAELQAALAATSGSLPDRTFSLNQIRRITAVRHLVPVIALDAINFDTGSSVIRAEEARALSVLGTAMRDAIQDDPTQVFLIEGHTDTVGSASYNLALSDRRAESVALALSEYFDVPPSNMIVQGYGEGDLKVRRAGDVRANRRGAVRNITPLLRGR